MIDKTNFTIEVFHNTPIIQGVFKGPGLDRKHHLQQILPLTSIDGLVLEFGVYQGKTIKIISNYFKDQTVWGFDSFEGLPEDWKTTRTGKIDHPKGHFKVDNLPTVPNNVKLVKGFFNESLPNWLKENQQQIKFLHLDADLYSSTIEVLSLLNSQIVPGTIIAFDEMYPWRLYHMFDNWEEGEFKALKEWLQKFDRGFEPLLRNRYQQCSIRIIK